jgi:replication-associated recombination protein RarA
MKVNRRIGATTENPSFKITSALLSRCRVFVLAPLTTDHVQKILKRAYVALCDDKCVQGIVSDEIIDYLADLADGDGILLVGNTDESEERIEYVRVNFFYCNDSTSEK